MTRVKSSARKYYGHTLCAPRQVPRVPGRNVGQCRGSWRSAEIRYVRCSKIDTPGAYEIAQLCVRIVRRREVHEVEFAVERGAKRIDFVAENQIGRSVMKLDRSSCVKLQIISIRGTREARGLVGRPRLSTYRVLRAH